MMSSETDGNKKFSVRKAKVATAKNEALSISILRRNKINKTCSNILLP